MLWILVSLHSGVSTAGAGLSGAFGQCLTSDGRGGTLNGDKAGPLYGRGSDAAAVAALLALNGSPITTFLLSSGA